MITRCPVCLGKKTIVGLGTLIKDCPNCDGIGHIKVVLNHDDILKETNQFVDTNKNVFNVLPNKPQKGRPKTSKNNEAS